jgi:hypothetical protein
MPPLVAVAAGVGAGVAVSAAGAAVGAAIIVGAGVAVAAYESGAAEWVYDEVITPVADAVGDVLRSDIGQFVLKAAATITPGMQWAVPLIDAAGTLARGGDIGDALKSAAISYVGTKVGNVVGETVGQSVASATGSATVGQIVGAGAGRASVALVMGQDPVKAFISGGINAGISAAAGWIEQQGIESGMGNTWTNLPDAAKNVISSSLSAALSGQNITEEVIWNAVLSSDAVTKTVSGFLEKNTGLNDGQISALTMGLQRTAAVAFSGGDVPQAILNQLDNYAQDQFKDWFDDTEAGIAINNTMDKITGDYQRVAAQADKLDELGKEYNSSLAAYESTVNEINTGVDTTNSLETAYKRALQNFQANETQANADKLTAAVNAYNEHVTAFNKRYEDVLKPNLDYYEKRIPALENEFTIATESYDSLIGDLSVTAEQLNDELTPMYKELDKTFVRFMDPDFNEAEYRAIAGLDADEDAYMHWLSTGKERGLPTNMAAYQAEYDARLQGVVRNAASYLGVDVTQMNEVQRKALYDLAEGTANGDITALKNIGFQDLARDFVASPVGSRVGQLGNLNQIRDAVSQGIAVEITPEIADMLTAAGVNDFMLGESLIQSDVQALTDQYISEQVDVLSASREGVTDEDIASGNARLLVDDRGLLRWGEVSVDMAYWDPNFETLVRRVYDRATPELEGAYQVVDAMTGEVLTSALQFDIYPSTSIYDLQDSSPGVFAQAISGLNEAAQDVIASEVGQAVVDFANKYGEWQDQARAARAKAIADITGESVEEVTARLEESDDRVWNYGGLVIKAGGELLGTMTALVDVTLGFDPNSNPVGAFADDMITFGADMQTDAWTEAYGRIQDRLGEGEGWERVTNIWGAFQEAPEQFVAEIIGKELVQELPWIIASRGTMTGAKNIFRAIGTELSDRAVQRIGIGTASALDLAESFGGAADNAYNTALAAYLESGMSQSEAENAAMELAQSAGLISAVTTLASFGIGGNDFEKAILGRETTGITADAFDWIVNKIGTGASVSWKEGVQESIEEGLPTLFVETILKQVDPNRDVLGNVAQAAALGAIAGAGTAGGIYTGSTLTDLMLRTDPRANTIVTRAKAGEITVEEATNALTEYLADVTADTEFSTGAENELIRNNLLSTIDDQYHSSGSVSRAFSAHPDFVVGNADILNGVLNSVGTDVTTYVNTYVDERYVDIGEVKAAAAAEGVNLTDEQAQKYVTQTDDPNATTATLYSIQQEYDPQGVTFQEAKAQFEALGFTPTDAQVRQFVGEFNESEKLADIAPYVDPRQVTEEEARQFYADLGYTPTDEEIQQFVGQGNENYEQTAPDRVNTYVDPRQVTDEEARQFFADLGYEPTDEQVANFVAQVEETAQQGAISRYVDPRQVTMTEVQQIADEEGLTLTEALAQTYIGQGQAETFQQERLAAARAEYDPLATTQEEATQFFADTGYNATIEEIVQFVASKTEEAQTSAIGAYVDPRQVTAAEAEEFLSSIGYQPSQEEINQFVGQMNDANYQVTQQAAIDEYVDPRYFDAGEIRAAYEQLGLVDVLQEDIDRFIGQYDPDTADYGADEFESTRLTELQSYMPTATFNVIKSVIGSPAVEDDPNTEVDESKEATGIYAEFEAGATRDEALQSAIDQLATELGVTKDEVLAQIGLTEETLGAEIDAVAEDVTAIKGEVTGLGEQITGVEEQLGKQITGVEEQLGAFEAATDQDLDFISNLIGKPARDVTQTDVDFVADLVAQQQVLDELSLEYQQYDVNNDGLLDINDQTLLEQAMAGEEVQLAPESAFVTDPTGVYGALYNTQQDIQTQMDQNLQTQLDAITQMNTQINTQMQEDQRRRNVSDLRNMLMQQQDLYGQQVSVRTPDPMRINYFYDFSSIFANPQQASLFPSPYAKGGQVEDTTDKLLRIIGE